ncbi:uncharacterized protein TEOVI_000357600 [Trypanosoma equiperdum]|uniref:Uncharacterized protein n=2 Tax=Trypanozoon TaxID=39700 RepID=Q57X61_TRYB2|nr:hypothetical protein, conserved [Trypanosoma brucei brucei TREU927]AAX69808.1 hypothetical protein, conserved [Trypanosoma brucei]AAZ12509.1 hypothetical protein, conserved [Trypanosoma brucei brucei TREU927]SCU71994.1 hypothetical protein, conserved [Trypanosoma equiperdum]
MLSQDARDNFLHRCCVQISSDLSNETVLASEIQHTLRFVNEHAQAHPKEITRALVWRVVDTEKTELDDRVGAWLLLNAVLMYCTEEKRLHLCASIIEEINSFLPDLIAHHWCFGRNTSRLDTLGANGGSTNGEDVLDAYGPGVVAALFADKNASPSRSKELRSKGLELLETWKKVWRGDVYQRLKQATRTAEQRGSKATKDGSERLRVPPDFRDSLHRLRRRKSRPSLSHHLLRCYGWTPPAPAAAEAPVQESGDVAAAGAVMGDIAPMSNSSYIKTCLPVPASTVEVDALDTVMHPHARMWLHELVEKKGGCPRCDVWTHTEAQCPCERPFVRFPMITANGQQNNYRRSHYYSLLQKDRGGVSRRNAAEILFKHRIRLPLVYEEALDCIVNLIKNAEPYDQLLDAFDTVRGATTGPRERHAMWIHASYGILPSSTVFGKPNDEALSPAMERVHGFLKKSRRFREWDQLLQSVEVLDIHFRQAKLPAQMYQSIKEVQETNSFFHCLIDGSLPEEYPPDLYACVPTEVQLLRPVKDILCYNCLEPFHAATHCTRRKEPWDLHVARNLLKEHNLLAMKYPEESHLLEEALKAIDMSDRKAKRFRKDELFLAVKLINDNRIPYCKTCDAMGHGTRWCEVEARRVLEQHHLKVIDIRLNPGLVQDRIQRLRADRNVRDSSRLSDAWEVLGKDKAYPESFLTAIKELTDARIPLAAARYSTATVRAFLLYVKSNDLLQHLAQLQVDNFPDVCLFCDSYYHASEDCEKAKDEERGFLREVRYNGLTLWEYLRKEEWYNRHFPTDFTKGQEAVVRLANQFKDDYSPGGVGRRMFEEYHNLSNTFVDRRYGENSKHAAVLAHESRHQHNKWNLGINHAPNPLDTPLSQLVLCSDADAGGEQVPSDEIGVLEMNSSFVEANINSNGSSNQVDNFSGYNRGGLLETPNIGELMPIGSDVEGGMRRSLLPPPVQEIETFTTSALMEPSKKRSREADGNDFGGGESLF